MAPPASGPGAGGHVAILHPDLGLGGAERLVVDQALALQEAGRTVIFYTSHYDPGRCFAETRDMNVVVHGDWLPRHILGRGHIVFALLRAVWLATAVALFHARPAVYLADQISVYNLVLRVFTSVPIIFYCHFPDQLLSTRGSLLKRLYRVPFDALEEWTTGLADVVHVNSKFTGTVFASTFKSLASRIQPAVLYPAVRVSSDERAPLATSAPPLFLSINRFERKKNVLLALEAFAALRDLMEAEAQGSFASSRAQLVLAGGCDSRVAENVEYHAELVERSKALGFEKDQVRFVLSFTDEQKAELLDSALALLYTPANEHFGIVPIECMAASRPVIAANSGGPRETVASGETGFLCEPDPKDWAARMGELLADRGLAASLGAAGARRVAATFSFRAFRRQLVAEVERTAAMDAGVTHRSMLSLLLVVCLGLLVLVLAFLLK